VFGERSMAVKCAKNCSTGSMANPSDKTVDDTAPDAMTTR
jgi:hypothetical protein